jgi:DDE superfamily endonuclease
MEEVLDVYQRPYDPQRPVIGVDEKPVQLLSEPRPPLPCQPGKPRRRDYEYHREGVANLFCAFEPLGNTRQLQVTPQRTKGDWARFIQDLVGQYPQADRLVLVMDNLNTHSPASLYDTFAPEEARRLSQKLEIHYTPKHGSWLNVAEIELSAVGRRLQQRTATLQTLARGCAAIQADRNAARRGADWQFTTADARIRLKRLYPSIET